MTPKQFDDWLAYHTQAFPSLKAWLAEHEGTVDRWCRALAGVRLSDAKRASDALLSGDAERPHGWSEHPAAIRRWIAAQGRQGPRTIDGRDVYDCHLCLDTGIVTVWNPIAMRQAAHGDELEPQQARIDVCGVSCTCHRGDPHEQGHAHRKPLYRYDESRMVRVTGDGRADVSSLRAFVELDRQRRVERLDGYSSELAEWNE